MQMNPDTIVNYPDAAKALISERPIWATVAFAVAVFSGMLGDILLLLKKSVSLYLFIASFIGALVTNSYTFNVTNAVDIWISSLMSIGVAAFLIWHSRKANIKGWIN
jgi:multisubunit Na+/H+ antiporter MnhE subunit